MKLPVDTAQVLELVKNVKRKSRFELRYTIVCSRS
jgi:hypothetical protein